MNDKLRRAASKSIPMSKKLLKLVGKTNAEFKLIGEGDKVLVGLSGGKDSLALVHVMIPPASRAFGAFFCILPVVLPDIISVSGGV